MYTNPFQTKNIILKPKFEFLFNEIMRKDVYRFKSNNVRYP